MSKFVIVPIVLYLCIFSTIALPLAPYVTDVKIDDFKYCENENFTLQFSNSVIKSIGQDFIASPLITCLDLSYNDVRDVHRHAFRKMPNLKYLNLEGNPVGLSKLLEVEYLDTEVLILSNVKQDYCCGNSIETINKIYPKLRMLDISSNGLQGIKLENSYDSGYSTIRPFPELQHLNLSNNLIADDNFQEVLPSNLTHLYLDNNQITEGYMKHLENLLVLTLDSNDIPSLTSRTSLEYGFDLSELQSLKHLSIAKNKIVRIYPYAFDLLTDLEYLDLSHNQLELIDGDMFLNQKKLRHLILNDNLLGTILPGALPVQLTYLAINCNNLKYLPTEFFINVLNLRTLMLAGNSITDFETIFHPSVNLDQLEALYLGNNALSSLPSDWDANFVNLKYLDVSNNKFNSLEALSLTKNSSLEKINFRSNTLKYLYATSFKNLPDNLTIDVASDEDNAIIKCNGKTGISRHSGNRHYYG